MAPLLCVLCHTPLKQAVPAPKWRLYLARKSSATRTICYPVLSLQKEIPDVATDGLNRINRLQKAKSTRHWPLFHDNWQILIFLQMKNQKSIVHSARLFHPKCESSIHWAIYLFLRYDKHHDQDWDD